MFGIGKKGKVKKAVKSALADDVLTDVEVRELEQLAEQTGVSAEYINDCPPSTPVGQIELIA